MVSRPRCSKIKNEIDPTTGFPVAFLPRGRVWVLRDEYWWGATRWLYARESKMCPGGGRARSKSAFTAILQLCADLVPDLSNFLQTVWRRLSRGSHNRGGTQGRILRNPEDREKLRRAIYECFSARPVRRLAVLLVEWGSLSRPGGFATSLLPLVGLTAAMECQNGGGCMKLERPVQLLCAATRSMNWR